MTQEEKKSKYGRTFIGRVCFFFFFLFFHTLSGFPVAVPVSIASVDANIISIVLNFVFWGPAPEVLERWEMARAGHRLGRMAGIAVGLGRSTATATETYLQGHVTTRSRPTIPVSFFFLQPVAGLTNRVPVRDFRAGAPLLHGKGMFFLFFFTCFLVLEAFLKLYQSP